MRATRYSASEMRVAGYGAIAKTAGSVFWKLIEKQKEKSESKITFNYKYSKNKPHSFSI